MIQLLLNLICQGIIFFVLIVGIGGLGKIVIAQLVFHDEEVVKSNFELKMWVCVFNTH